MKTDLHTHTNASDGLHTPTRLIEIAKSNGVTIIAVTDHDTIAGHDEAVAAGKSLGVRVIRGIEVSALSQKGEVHVLGYGIPPRAEIAPHALATLDNLRNVRKARAEKMLAKLAALGVQIPFDTVAQLAGDAVIGRPHVARALLNGDYVQTIQEAFERYIGEGKPAYAPHEGLSPVEAVELIHALGGIAVMAHPALYIGDLPALLGELVAHGLDGIECRHPSATVEQSQQYAAFAHKHNLLISAGSDYHGKPDDHAPGTFTLSEAEWRAVELKIGH